MLVKAEVNLQKQTNGTWLITRAEILELDLRPVNWQDITQANIRLGRPYKYLPHNYFFAELVPGLATKSEGLSMVGLPILSDAILAPVFCRHI